MNTSFTNERERKFCLIPLGEEPDTEGVSKANGQPEEKTVCGGNPERAGAPWEAARPLGF